MDAVAMTVIAPYLVVSCVIAIGLVLSLLMKFLEIILN